MTDRPPSTERSAPRERLGALRIVLIIIGTAAALFSGGCSLLILSDGIAIWPFVLVLGGTPFAFSLLVIWMAWKLGRGPAPAGRAGDGDM